MKKLTVRKWGDKIQIEGCSRIFESGEILLSYLNFTDIERLSKMFYKLNRLRREVLFPIDDPYVDNYPQTVEKAQNYMTQIEEYVLSLPPYCDIKSHETPETRLFALLNKYKHLFVGGDESDGYNEYDKDDADEYDEDEFILDDHSFSMGKYGERELFIFEPDAPSLSDAGSLDFKDGVELQKKTGELVDEYLEMAAQILRVHYVYKPLLDKYIHEGLTAMPSAGALANRIGRFFKEQKPAMHIYDKMNDMSETSVRYAVVTDAEGNSIVERVTEYNTLGDYLYADLFECMLSGLFPKKCKHCGRYFMIRGGYYTEYCENVAPDETDKTCREVGARKSFDEKVKNDPVWLAHQRAYKAHYARMMKKKMTKSEFLEWSDMALALRTNAQKGLIPFAEYERKLKE